MKKALMITILLAGLTGLALFLRSRLKAIDQAQTTNAAGQALGTLPEIDESKMSEAQKIAAVIVIIKATPAWLAHVSYQAKNGTLVKEWSGFGWKENGEPPMGLESRLLWEAKYHLSKRSLQDIRNNPNNFLGW